VRNGAGVPERRPHEPVEWGVASRCRSGELLSGDLAVVELLQDGALVAAVDGLGHGREAARAAQAAASVVREDAGRDLVALVGRCHEAMAGTRGAAISLAYVSTLDSTVTWLGVGNVEGRVLNGDLSKRGPRESLALHNGVPGHQLPDIASVTLNIAAGDVLILATDGVAAGFADSLSAYGSAQAMSERIMADHGGFADDALVLTVRYLGGHS
jgi:phosphoserine phosphatase RsbX